MTYIVLTAISALFLALYDLFKKMSVKDKKSINEVLFYFCFVAFICSLFFAKEAIKVDIKSIFIILLKSIIISLSWFFTTKAMSKLEMSIVVPFTLLGTVTTTFLSWVFFKERIGYVQIVGCLIIFMGLIILSRIGEKRENFKNDYKYLLLLVLASVLSSVSAIVDRYLLFDVNKTSLLFWFFLFLSMIYFFVCIGKKSKINIKVFCGNLWVVGVGVSIFVSDLFYYWAVSYDNASLSLISIIRKLSVFIGVVLASAFLKEKYFVRKFWTLLVMFAGLGIVLFV